MPTTSTTTDAAAAPQPATSRPARRRPFAALLATLLGAVLTTALTLSTFVALPAPLAANADDRAERWAGFRIPATGRAAGGWIGGYRLDGTPVFVITPGRRPNRAGFRAADATSDLRGPKGPSAAATQRAAWILSKYGGHKDAVQAAAVDAAVLHLLGGRAWQLGARRGAARVRASGDPATVRRYVRLMLRGSRASAGPHEVTIEPTTADVGGVTAVTVRVTDGHGGPVAGLPVTVTSPDGGVSQPAAGPIEAVTGDDGRALVRLAAPLAGWRTVVAEVGQVPLHWLRVRGADRERQAAAAEGGVRRTIAASARVAVRGPQSLSLTAADDDITVGSPASVAATVAGTGEPRTVTASLHGPFPSRVGVACDRSEVGRVTSTVAIDGTYQLPNITPSVSGYYAWNVTVAGTDTSHAVTACGAATTVKAVATITVAAQELALAAANVAHARIGLSALPRSPAMTVTATLWGPFPSEVALRAGGCSGNRMLQDQKRMNGDGSEVFDVYVSDIGWYAWQAEVPPDELRMGSRSACLAAGTVVEVRAQ